MLAWQWSARFLGFISTLILARLLTPRDYGIVAIGMLVISFLEILTVLGGDRYLISKPNVDSEDYDTAWSIRLIQFIFISAILWVFSSSMSVFFQEAQIDAVIKVLSVGVFITAFENVGIVKFKRDLQFSQLFRFGIFQKSIGFFVTVFLAFTMRNYWAMIIGFVFLRLAGTVLSYIISDYRPKFTFLRIKQQWSFSQWILLGNCAVYFRNKADQLIISKFFGASSLGNYNMAVDISNMPTTELTSPIFQAVFSGFGKLVTKPKELEIAYLKFLGALACVILPIAFGLASVADNAVILLLGPKWVSTIPLIQLLSIMSIPMAYSMSAIDFLTINNLVKKVCIVDWVIVSLLLPLLIITSIYGTLQQVALVRTLFSFGSVCLYFYVIKINIGINLVSVFMAIFRPVISAITMAFFLNYLGNIFFSGILVNLILQIFIGALIYLIILLLSWLLMGKPDGGEQILLDRLKEKIDLWQTK